MVRVLTTPAADGHEPPAKRTRAPLALAPPAGSEAEDKAWGEGGKGKHKGQQRGGTADLASIVHDLAKRALVHDEQLSSVEGILLATWLTEADFDPSVKASDQRNCTTSR